MKEIENKEDIKFMVDTFYDTVRRSTIIGHFFNEVVQINWKEHMPTMYDFWSDILLGTSEYKGNPMTKHFALNKLSKMEAEHFVEWLQLWKANIDLHFNGAVAEEAKSRAENIARIMSFKVVQQ
jgi:hemoglobin